MGPRAEEPAWLGAAAEDHSISLDQPRSGCVEHLGGAGGIPMCQTALHQFYCLGFFFFCLYAKTIHFVETVL